MDKFKFWYLTNQTKICWFIIGWLTLGILENLGRGDYINALISAGLIWLNLALNK
jgi:hypothetical protein